MKHFVWVGLFFFCLSSQAKNLDGRFAAGFAYQKFTQDAAISFKIFHNPFLASNYLFSLNTENNSFLFGGRVLRNVLLEENLNLYLGLAGLILSQNGTGGTETGLEIDALLGSEFFLAGLPNLGLSFEVGVGLRSIRTTSFRTMGGGFASGGIHYYF
jgi:hypothetical protein